MRGLARDSAARFFADVGSFAAGAIAAVITARWLGPSGKGILSVLTFLTIIFARVATLGLGEATVVFVGQRRATADTAIRAALAVLLVSSATGALVLLAVAAGLIQPDSREVWIAIALSAATLPLTMTMEFFSYLLVLRHRVVRASLMALLTSGSTTLGILVFVVLLDGGLIGAVAASTMAAFPAIAYAAQPQLLGWPKPAMEYIRDAVRYGLRVESAFLAMQGAARLDLVMVLLLGSKAMTGVYSVALTVGMMVTVAPAAVAYAAFPRLAERSLEEAAGVIAALTRTALVAGALAAAVIGAAAVPAIPFLFGSNFDGAVVPAVILAGGGIPWAGQWMLARSAAATGDPSLLLRSFGSNLALMLLLDVVAIPWAGSTGAALASTLGTVAGFGICIHWYRSRGIHPRSIVPSSSDATTMARQARDVFALAREP